MIDVVKEPNIRLVKVLLEGHSVAIGDLEFAFVSILAQKSAHDALLSVLCHSVVVVHD